MRLEHQGGNSVRERVRFVVDLLVAVVLLVAASLVVWNNWPRSAVDTSRPIPTTPVSIANDAHIGYSTAQVVVVEYSDFQCPFCGTFARDTFPAVKKRLIDTRQVRWVFKHLPLAKLHPEAVAAAKAAECGRKQNKFWQLHDQFFLQQKQLQPESITAIATSAGLDMEAFSQCLTGEAEAKIAASLREADVLKIGSTPTFLIGTVAAGETVTVTQRLSGASSLEEFEAAVRLAAQPQDQGIGSRWIWPVGAVVAFAGFLGVRRWRKASSGRTGGQD